MSRILSNSMILMGAEVIRKVLRLLLVVVAARILGDDVYGRFAWSMGTTMLFWILADMGIHQLIIREISRRPGEVKKILANGLAVKLLLSAGTGGALILLITLLGRPHEVFLTTVILTGSLLFMSFLELFKSIFHAFQRMIYDGLMTLLETVLIVGGGLAVIASGGGIISLAWVYMIAFALTMVCAMLIVIRKFTPIAVEWNRETVRYLVREGLPIGINHFFAMVYTYVDTFMLGLMINDEVVGWYNAAFRLRFAMQFIGASIVKAVYPPLSASYHENRDTFTHLFERAFKVLLFFGIAMAVVVSIEAERIMLFFFTEEYRPGATVLQIMVWALVFVFLNLLMAHTTRASDRQRFSARVVAVGAFFNVALNAFLIPAMSFRGAAYATLATEGLTFTAHLIYLNRNLVRPPLFSQLPKLVIIMAVPVLYLHFIHAHVAIQVPAAFGLIAVMAWLVRYFDPQELNLLRTVLRKRTGPRTGS
jgi:O-antigen/teichoic acid export membrane protein